MTTQKERFDVLRKLNRAGLLWNEAVRLCRIATTLQRWHELECGVDGGGIERNETTGKVTWYSFRTGQRSPFPDRETGALRRLKEIMRPYSKRLVAYVQGDPRGAPLYLVRRKDIPKGQNLDSYYSRGIAVY